ncbi:hypothetical protein F53441_1657 [Fusarium austroafricanum]|uniref:Uncharacterized protein n=1 Tax=Fusarium austroafricanum TaxID=2364996 RepID=A0A8H4KUW3_9HYPO|nr:hypothetical protein F53441_1657 [Fusarium austroafricanum]
MDQQLLFLRDDLKSQARPQLWGQQIQQAPECIILIAQCKLLASKPSLAALNLSNNDLKPKPLLTEIQHFAQMGEDAFRSTARGMETVGYLAFEMWKTDGILEKVLRHIDMKQNAVRDKRLQSYIESGLAMIDDSIKTIATVKEGFSQWKTMTRNLLDLLGKKICDNVREQEEVTKQLEDGTNLKVKCENDLEKLRVSKVNLEQSYDEILRGYNEVSNKLKDYMPGGGMIFASIIAAATCPWSLKTLLQIGSQWTIESRIRNLELEIDSLNTHLRDKQSENGSLTGVTRVLKGTLEEVSKLQVQIENFMDFLIGIQNIMTIVKDGGGRVLIKDLTTEGLDAMNNDPELKADYRQDAHLMKDRFLIASKAAALYNEVSNKFIVPGTDWRVEEIGIELKVLTHPLAEVSEIARTEVREGVVDEVDEAAHA